MGYNAEDLALALDLSSDHIKSVSYSSPAIRTVLVLAAATSHITAAFAHEPRLFITGPYGTGKSTLLTAVQYLVANPVRNSGQLSTTFAYRNDFRAAAADGVVPVSICDETAHIFGANGKKGSQHPLYTIGTEGYMKSGAPVRFQEKDMNVSYSCFQLCIFASRSPQALPEDVLDRAIQMTLARKPEGMKLGSIEDPTFLSNGEQCGLFLRTAVMAAEKQIRMVARDTDWYSKAKLDNRTADIWIPLFAIAEVAGGQWPSMVQAAYSELGAKNSRNLPTQFQLKVDVLSFLDMGTFEADAVPCKDLIEFLSELGRKCYTWDDVPFTIKRFGMELRASGAQVYKSNSTAYYRFTDDWLKQADRLANPVTVDTSDPDNDWSVLDEFVEGE